MYLEQEWVGEEDEGDADRGELPDGQRCLREKYACDGSRGGAVRTPIMAGRTAPATGARRADDYGRAIASTWVYAVSRGSCSPCHNRLPAHVRQEPMQTECLHGLPSERAATRACGFTDLLDQGLHEQVAEECQRAEEKSLERCQHRDTSVDDAAIVIVVATDGLDRARGEDIVWLIDREWTGCCDTACGLRCD